MKTWGIICIVFGILGIIGAMSRTQQGNSIGVGLGVIVLGIYLLSRANKKKEDAEKKKKWEDGE
jgi:uncharacterized membrane protein YfcA